MKPLFREDLEHVLSHTRNVWPSLRHARLLITGGTGFFGKWLLETFQYANRELSLDAHAMVLSRDPAAFLKQMPHLGEDPCIAFLRGDIGSFPLPAGAITHILHAATETTTRHGIAQPLETLGTIVTGTGRILDLAHERHVQAMLLTSSGAVYGRQPPEMTHIPEEYAGAPDPLDPNAAYGNCKRYAEHLCAAYHAQHGVPAKIARCFAFVGPHLPLDAHFAIGNFLRDGMCGSPIRVNGDGTPYRSYLYAADLAVWLWTMLVHAAPARAYNVGSEDALTIGALAQRVAEQLQQPLVITRPPAGRPAERYVPSTQRAQRELQLASRVTLDGAIERTISWHGKATGWQKTH